MNRYTLDADGNRWWWGSALAGTACTAALVAVTALPGAGQAMPVPSTRHEATPAYVGVDAATDVVDGTAGQCFLHRATWNEALDWPQPVCRFEVRHADETVARPAVLRPGLDWRP